MLYLSKKNDYELSTGGTFSLVVLVPLLMLGLSFLPGLPKGLVVAHEWGTQESSVPLRLPLARPLYLARGDAISIHYAVVLRSGRFVVRMAHAETLPGLFFAKADAQVLSVSMSGAGAARFTAPRDGYYLISPMPEIAGPPRQCPDDLMTLLKAAVAATAPCATYNTSYRLTVY